MKCSRNPVGCGGWKLGSHLADTAWSGWWSVYTSKLWQVIRWLSLTVLGGKDSFQLPQRLKPSHRTPSLQFHWHSQPLADHAGIMPGLNWTAHGNSSKNKLCRDVKCVLVWFDAHKQDFIIEPEVNLSQVKNKRLSP